MKESKQWVLVLTCLILLLGSCVFPGDSDAHPEQSCTLVFQSAKMFLQEDGSVLIDQREIKNLTCRQVWIKNTE